MVATRSSGSGKSGFRSPGRTMLALLLALAGSLVAFGAPEFRAELEPDSIAAGETAMLKLIFTDLGDVAAPALPDLTNCPAQFAGSGTQMMIVNFQRSSSIIHQYVLRPTGPGVVEIPSLAVDIGGKRYASNPLKLRVGQGFDTGQLGFLRLVVPKTDFYVGETVPVEIRFYFKHAPARQNPPRLRLDGFIKGKETADNLPPETINGEVYSVYRQVIALTAAKAGDLQLGPAEFETVYVFRSNRRRSIFDDPFFGGGGEQKQITFTSEPVAIHVSPPPPVNQPAGFAGAVGRFLVDSISASPTNVAVGDPVTVRLAVRGRGNFSSLKLPDLPAGSGFQSYPGTNSLEETDVLGLEGVKTFEQVVVPEHAGVQALRLPPFIAWNPESRRYDVLEPRRIALNVRAGASAQALPAGNVPTAAATDPAGTRGPAAPEIVPLKTRLGPLVAFSPPVVQRPWFFTLMLAAPLIYGALGLRDRIRARAQARGPDLRARRARAVSDALARIESAAGSGHSASFFDGLNEALQEQLAATLGASAGAFTEDVVATRLLPLGLPVEEGDRIRALFEAIAQARYSPVTSQTELANLAEAARSAIAALRRLEVSP